MWSSHSPHRILSLSLHLHLYLCLSCYPCRFEILFNMHVECASTLDCLSKWIWAAIIFIVFCLMDCARCSALVECNTQTKTKYATAGFSFRTMSIIIIFFACLLCSGAWFNYCIIWWNKIYTNQWHSCSPHFSGKIAITIELVLRNASTASGKCIGNGNDDHLCSTHRVTRAPTVNLMNLMNCNLLICNCHRHRHRHRYRHSWMSEFKIVVSISTFIEY